MQLSNARYLTLACLAWADFSAAAVGGTTNLKNLVDESILMLGDFDAISFYNTNDSYAFNGDTNIYELSSTNNSVQYLSTLNISSYPSIWQPVDNNTSIMVIDDKPYIYSLPESSLQELKNWDNVDGTIGSILYDASDKIFYFGGSLSYNNSYGAIQYDYSSEKLSSLPFGGFNENSIVNTIIKYADSDSIVFGGMFDDIGYPELLNITYNVTTTNHTSFRNSSNLIDISQKIPILASQVSASNGDNFENIICPQDDSNGWTLPPDQVGSWSATLQNEVTPSKIRLYNSQSDTNGVKSFRVITYPAQGIMNMSYVDPADMTIKHCDAFCPLYLSNDITKALSSSNITGNDYYTFTNDNQTVLQLTDQFQDFAFVNQIGVTSFTVQVMDFYGDQAELDGVELSRRGITVFANDTLNSIDTCSATNDYEISVSASSIGGVNWQSSPFGSSLVTNLSPDSITGEQGIKYEVNIPVSGQYSMLMYTSGCIQDNSCPNRGVVNVTVYDSFDTPLSNQLIFQTNEYEKYDTLYTGDLNINTNNQPVSIEMILLNQTDQSSINFVADSIQLQYIQLDVSEITGNITRKYNVTKHGLIDINGLLEYAPNNFTNGQVSYPIGNTSINQIGYMLSDDALVTQLVVNETSIIIAGDFNSVYGEGILGVDLASTNASQIKTSGFFSIGGGANGEVTQMYGPAEEFVLLGSFDHFKNATDSQSMNGGAIYDGRIQPLNVTNASEVSNLNGFVYNDTEYLLLGYNDSTTKLFDFTGDSMFENTSTLAMNITAVMDSEYRDWFTFDGPEASTSFVMGSILKYDTAAQNIVKIDDGSLNEINSLSNSSIVSGTYIGNSTFALGGSDIYLLNGNSASQLSSDIHIAEGSSVETIISYKSNLIFGVDGDATYKSTEIEGLAFYDMENSTLKTLNETFTGVIQNMVVDPEYGIIIAGGNFTVGKCQTLCTFGNNSDSVEISRAVSDINGVVSTLNYYDAYKVLIAGNFTASGTHGYIGLYDTRHNNISVIGDMSDQLSGPVSSFMFGNDKTEKMTLDDVIVVTGEDYIGYFNNSKWNSLANGLNLDDSNIGGGSLVNSTDSEQSFFDSQVLLLTGRLSIDNVGTVSSAIWNGEKWIPYTISSSGKGISKASAQSVVRMTSMQVYDGTFSGPTSSLPSSTSTPSSVEHKSSEFTNGQVAGVGFALALGTILLFGAAGLLYMFISGDSPEAIEGLRLTGEDRVLHEEKLPSS